MQFNTKLNPEANYWVTSDLHFGHKNIMKFCPTTRPYGSVTHMDEALIEHWNSRVAHNDVVFVLGDFSFYGVEKTQCILSRLNGKIVFVLGNHDKTLDAIKGLDTHRYLEVRYKGTKICMSHYAMRAWNHSHRGAVMLYGHSHGSMPDFGRSTDVGWDAQGEIMSLDRLVTRLLALEIQVEDGH